MAGRRQHAPWRAAVVFALAPACASSGGGPDPISGSSLSLTWPDAELEAYVAHELDRLSRGADAPVWADDLARVDGRPIVSEAGGRVYVTASLSHDAAGHAGADEICSDLAASVSAASDLPSPLTGLVVVNAANVVLAECAPDDRPG